MKIFLQIFLSLLILSHQLIFAGTTGRLAGRITDTATGEPLPFVNVVIMGTTLGAASDIDGYYSIINIPPGNYVVKASAIGYNSVSYQDVKVSIDLTTTIDFQLSEASVELGEEVVVIATRPLVRMDLTSSTAIVGDDVISQLPVAEVSDVLKLQAGIVISSDGGIQPCRRSQCRASWRRREASRRPLSGSPGASPVAAASRVLAISRAWSECAAVPPATMRAMFLAVTVGRLAPQTPLMASSPSLLFRRHGPIEHILQHAPSAPIGQGFTRVSPGKCGLDPARIGVCQQVDRTRVDTGRLPLFLFILTHLNILHNDGSLLSLIRRPVGRRVLFPSCLKYRLHRKRRVVHLRQVLHHLLGVLGDGLIAIMSRRSGTPSSSRRFLKSSRKGLLEGLGHPDDALEAAVGREELLAREEVLADAHEARGLRAAADRAGEGRELHARSASCRCSRG